MSDKQRSWQIPAIQINQFWTREFPTDHLFVTSTQIGSEHLDIIAMRVLADLTEQFKILEWYKVRTVAILFK